jgi:hypothetical protein
MILLTADLPGKSTLEANSATGSALAVFAMALPVEVAALAASRVAADLITDVPGTT